MKKSMNNKKMNYGNKVMMFFINNPWIYVRVMMLQL